MLKFMIWKEFLQLKRDKKMFGIIFMAPVIQLIVLGYAANFDVERISTAVCDYDRSDESAQYLDRYFSGGYFERTININKNGDIDKFLEKGEIQAAIVIPSGFGRNIAKGTQTDVQLIINGSDTNYATNAFNYAAQITARFSTKILLEKMALAGMDSIPQVKLEQRLLYNPELKTKNFMVPAIMGLILMIITVMLTSMAIVREKEMGTIEQLIVTPIKKGPVLAGKLIPFLIIGLIDVALVTAVAIFLFRIPFKGSFFLLFCGAILFLFNTLGLGLFVSTVSATQQQAMMTVMFVIMMPFIYLSGFVFPVENMPLFFQYISEVIPLTHFLIIVRGLFLKGSNFADLAPHLAAMLTTGMIIFAVSMKRFRKYI